MLRNIDVIYSLQNVCIKINSIEAEIDSICEMEQCCIDELKRSLYEAIFIMSTDELCKAKLLLKQLTMDYVAKIDNTEIDYDDFIITIERAVTSREKLISNIETIFELFGCLWGFCETAILEYKQMVQPCYVDDLVHIDFMINK